MRSLAFMLIAYLLLAPVLGQSAMTYTDAQTIIKPPGQKDGKTVDGTFIIDPAKKELSFKSNKGVDQFNIPYDKVTSLLYERTSRPRYVSAILLSPLFLLAKGKKHFLTVQYNIRIRPAKDSMRSSVWTKRIFRTVWQPSNPRRAKKWNERKSADAAALADPWDSYVRSMRRRRFAHSAFGASAISFVICSVILSNSSGIRMWISGLR
jgi:hypothetical protein